MGKETGKSQVGRSQVGGPRTGHRLLPSHRWDGFGCRYRKALRQGTWSSSCKWLQNCQEESKTAPYQIYGLKVAKTSSIQHGGQFHLKGNSQPHYMLVVMHQPAKQHTPRHHNGKKRPYRDTKWSTELSKGSPFLCGEDSEHSSPLLDALNK